MFFFFKQKTAYEMRISDWSSDVCSSDLATLSSIGGATTKLKVTQSATLVRAPAKICQNLPRNAGNASRRHCRDGLDRVDQDCQGFHVRDAAGRQAKGPPPSRRNTRRPVVDRRRSGGAGRAAGGARRPRSLG